MTNLKLNAVDLNYKINFCFDDKSFLMDILGIDYPNLNCFKEIAKEVNYYEDECSDIIIDFFVDCNINPFDDRYRPIDIVAILNNHILNKARDDILKLKDFDIYDTDIEYYPNYFCYCLRCNEKDAKKIATLIKSIPKNKRSKEVNRLYNGLLNMF